MEFTDFMLWKMGIGAVFFFFMGYFGLLPEQAKSEKPPSEAP